MADRADTIEIEIPFVFYPAFVKSILECNMEKRPMKILSEEKTKENSWIITVHAQRNIDLYYLGRKYGSYRSEI